MIAAKNVYITSNENLLQTLPGGTMSAAIWKSNFGTISTDGGTLTVNGNFINSGTISSKQRQPHSSRHVVERGYHLNREFKSYSWRKVRDERHGNH